MLKFFLKELAKLSYCVELCRQKLLESIRKLPNFGLLLASPPVRMILDIKL